MNRRPQKREFANAHPIDIIMASLPTETSAGRNHLSDFVMDFTGGGLISKNRSVEVAMSPLTVAEKGMAVVFGPRIVKSLLSVPDDIPESVDKIKWELYELCDWRFDQDPCSKEIMSVLIGGLAVGFQQQRHFGHEEQSFELVLIGMQMALRLELWLVEMELVSEDDVLPANFTAKWSDGGMGVTFTVRGDTISYRLHQEESYMDSAYVESALAQLERYIGFPVSFPNSEQEIMSFWGSLSRKDLLKDENDNSVVITDEMLPAFDWDPELD